MRLFGSGRHYSSTSGHVKIDLCAAHSDLIDAICLCIRAIIMRTKRMDRDRYDPCVKHKVDVIFTDTRITIITDPFIVQS